MKKVSLAASWRDFFEKSPQIEKIPPIFVHPPSDFGTIGTFKG